MKYRIVTHNGKYRIQVCKEIPYSSTMECGYKIEWQFVTQSDLRNTDAAFYSVVHCIPQWDFLKECKEVIEILNKGNSHEAGPWVVVEEGK